MAPTARRVTTGSRRRKVGKYREFFDPPAGGLDTHFCVEALEAALSVTQPEIFNTDQGSQFTSLGFTRILEDRDIRISMDGRGRVFDNIFVERLWRSVKYEEVYLKDYRTSAEAYRGLAGYFEFYNTERLHQALKYGTPQEAYQPGVGGHHSENAEHHLISA